MLLLLLAFVLYKFQIQEKAVKAAITGIYIAATFLGGFLAGKMMRVKRFFWGLVVGVLYFALLVLVSLGIYRTMQGNVVQIISSFLMCAGGGMLGAMLS